MTTPQFPRKELEAIMQSEDFDRLADYTDSKKWASLKKGDKELLGQLFVLAGQKKAKQHPMEAIASIKRAVKLLPGDSYPILSWGRILFQQGISSGDPQILQEAEELFTEALTLVSSGGVEEAKIIWEKGQCYYWTGRLSGEAVDFHRAIATFNTSLKAGEMDPAIHSDLGNAYCELASLIGRYELVQEALVHYQKVVDADPDSVDAWLNLGCSAHVLYDKFGDDEHFRIADVSFEEVIRLDPNSAVGYSQKGYLYTLAGKRSHNIELLKVATQIFENVPQDAQIDPLLLRRWGEASMLWGAYTEELSLLKFAEEKIGQAVDIEPDHFDGWYLWGTCFVEQGRYFSDDSYHELAIEKFQTGLTLDPKASLLWYGLSLATFCLGEARHDPSLIEKSTQYCQKVIEMGGDDVPQYWNDWGVSLMKLCELSGSEEYIQQAVEKFEEAIRRVPEGQEAQPEWLYNYGCACDFLGDFTGDEKAYEKSAEILRDLISLAPEYSYAAYNLALTLSHLGELTSDIEPFHEALDLFQLMSQADEEDELLYNDWGLALLNVAQLADDPHRPEKAQKFREDAEAKFMHALSLGSTQALYSLACLYSLTNHLELSMTYVQKALRANALPSAEDLMSDEWLENLRETDLFSVFVKQL